MSLLFAEGFDEWALAGFAREGYSGGSSAYVSQAIVAGRRAGSHALRFTQLGVSANNVDSYLRRDLGSSPSTLHVHMAAKFSEPPAQAVGRFYCGLFSFREAAFGSHTFVNTSPRDIGIAFRCNSGFVQYLLLYDSAWHTLEFKVHIAAAPNGTFEMRVDGATVISETGLDTKYSGSTGVIDQVTLGIDNTSFLVGDLWCPYNADIGDVVIFDTAGSVLNDFTGTLRVDTVLPTGAGSSTQWVPDSGANYARVNESPVNTSSYVQSDVASGKDLYAMGNISHATSGVKGLMVTAMAEKSGTDARSLRLHCKSGAVDSHGPTQTLVEDWSRVHKVYETNPATSTAWTETTVNAAQAGIENV